jgi:hypothetical protein
VSEVILGVDALGAPPWPTLDPFLFCVHHLDAYPRGDERLAPVASLAGRELGQDFSGKDGFSMYHGRVVPGFPSHPHRGFETVTIVRRGYVDHSDSLGAAARYGQGDVQWLTAGAGIQHAEMFPLLERDADNTLDLYQIWLNLPAADKMADPHFSMLWAEQIPRLTVRDEAGRTAEITIIAGAFGDVAPLAPPPRSWASRPDAHVAIWTLSLTPGARVTLPAAVKGLSRALYLVRGDGVTVGDRRLPARTRARLLSGEPAQLTAGEDGAELLVLQGRPIGEPVASYGPFVMNTRAEIQQAFADYQRTHFGGWPSPTDDPVSPRDAGRFAKHADGRLESR